MGDLGDMSSAAADQLRQQAFSYFGNDWPKAARLWEEFRDLRHDDPEGYAFGVLALRESGECDRAEALADGVLHRFSNFPRLFIERALICFSRRDWPEALMRFRDIRHRFPNELDGYIRGAAAAHELGDRTEALSILEEARARFPLDERLLRYYAALAEVFDDWSLAARLWQNLRLNFPKEDAFAGEIKNLSRAGTVLEAEKVLRTARATFPDDRRIMLLAAQNATRGADWDEAASRWMPFIHDRDLAAEAKSRIDDARRFISLRNGLETVPKGASLDAGAVMLPFDRLLTKSWSLRLSTGHLLGQNIRFTRFGEILNLYGAGRSWGAHDGVVCLFDEYQNIVCRLSCVKICDDGHIILSGRDWLQIKHNIDVILEEEGSPIGKILGRFESLGNNCEFGLVQRFFGIEPLGLFRFNWADAKCLVQGISDGFSELYTADCVQIRRDPSGEHIGHVDAYKYTYHTDRFDDHLDADRFKKSEANRLRFLARKLLEDMEEGDKILVRKGEDDDSYDQIVQLQQQIRQRGAATLLWVTKATIDHPPGSVELFRDGLLRGYIEQFAPPSTVARAMFTTWAKLCVTAHTMIFG